MEILFWTCLSLCFFFINYIIIKTDILEKRIPNKWLIYNLFILPFWYIYAWYFWYFEGIHYSIFIIQILISLWVSFMIYAFGIWGAWDAKYLCILWLYIPHIGIISYIWNIALLTLIYLFIFFVWFWVSKIMYDKKNRADFLRSLWTIKKEEFVTKNKGLSYRELAFNFLKWLNIFLVIFLGIRFLKIFVFSYIGSHYDILYLLQEYGIYILLWMVIITLAITLWIKYMLYILRKYIFRSPDDMVYIVSFISIIGIALLLYGYSLHPHYFSEKIILIFTVYLFLYLIMSFVWTAYRIIFKIQEQPLIHIDDLKEWTIIDKKWFDILVKQDHHIFWNIEISGSILSKEDVEIVKKVIYDVREREQIEHVPTYKTFGFALFIFAWLIVTFFYDSLLVAWLVRLYQIYFL